MKKINHLFFVLFLTPGIYAQSPVEFKKEILSTAIDKQGTQIAVSTVDSIYILNSATLQIRQRWSHKQELPVILGFHPLNNNILLLQQQTASASIYTSGMAAYGLSPASILESYSQSARKYNELPGDSITMWDIQQKALVHVAPGTLYMEFGDREGSYASVVNKAFPFQSQGRLMYGSRGAEIKTKDSDSTFTSTVKSSCRKLQLSPKQKYFAASWRDGYINDTLRFSFSIHHFRSHEPIYLIDNLFELPGDFSFSPDGRLLAVAGQWPTGTSVRIIDLAQRQVIVEIKELKESAKLQWSPSSDKLFLLKDQSEWIAWDIREARITDKVVRGLSGYSTMHSAIVVNDRLLLSGEKLGGMNEKHFVLKFLPLGDMEVYTRVSTGDLTSYADSSSYTMLLNDVRVSNEYPDIRFNISRTHFIREEKNHLQLWDVRKKRKLLQMSFHNEINAFPDITGKRVLVVEDNDKESSEFTLHVLSTANSTRTTSPIMRKGASVMDAGFHKCNCISNTPASWICVDGGENIWQVEGPSFTMKPLVTIKGMKGLQVQAGSDDNWYILSEKEDRTYDVWQWSKNSPGIKVVNGSFMDQMNILGEEIWMSKIYFRADTVIDVWKDGKRARTISFPGRIQKVDALPGKAMAVVQYETKKGNILQRTGENIQSAAQEIEPISARSYMISKKEVLVESEGFTSFMENANSGVGWSVKTPQILDITNYDVSPNGRYILIANRIIDLKEIEQFEIEKYEPAALLEDTGSLTWVTIHREIEYGNKKGGFTLYKYRKGQAGPQKSSSWFEEPSGKATFYFNHDKILVSPDRRWAVTFVHTSMLDKGQIKAPPVLWNLTTMKGEVILKEKTEDFSPSFSKDGRELVVTTLQFNQKDFRSSWEESRYTLSPFRLLQTRKNNTGIFPNKEDRFSSTGYGVKWEEPEGEAMKTRKTFYSAEPLHYVIFDPVSGIIAASAVSGNIIIWDSQGGASPLKTFFSHAAPVEKLLLRGQRVFSLAENGEIGITDLNNRKFSVQLKTIEKDDEIRVAMSTPAGHYRVDPDLMNHLHFVKGGEVFPLSSFELQGNRPDKVYEAIGLSDTSFINTLYQSWRTRVRRAGFDPDQLTDLPNRPAIDWSRDQLPSITSDSIFTLRARLSDRTLPIKTLVIKVNGVPEGGMKGIAAGNLQTVNIDRPVVLNEGPNNISVIAVNDAGIESVEETHDIIYEPAVKKPRRLIYIGVGVSRYADTSMNLKYAASDVEKITGQIRYYTDSVSTFPVLNEQATQKNILGLKKLLLNGSVDDVVIISFSGHGMTGKDKAFFFAPHEMDFSDPGRSGLSMEMIETLLDDIPARKRLLLLDACHSGENWNTDTLPGPLPSGVTAFRPKGVIVQATGTSSPTRKNSYLLMKELFGDFSRGNGAFMISAAANNEYAFEGDQWKNGVFTKSFLESLAELSRKNSYKGGVRVRELRKTIYEKVKTLTNGLQNPTSRQENGWWNWSF